MAGEKVLIIDDDKNIVRFLELELCHEGYSVAKEYDGAKGLRHALKEKFDLILLDIMLPSLGGMDVLRQFRASSDTPVIMLTAKDSVNDKVVGLDSGADDYITKPFAIEELLARMHALLKGRGAAAKSDGTDAFRCGRLALNRSTHKVMYGGVPVQLTKREFDLLSYLMKNHDTVCTRGKLLEKVWGYGFSGGTNLVDVYIRYLRNKIDYRFNVNIIKTIRCVGYMIKQNEKD
ncbi:MAG TPA: DNA-binding response regulator [Ruminococcaceae bacterium]|jgi:DNA-binding response OmpR family regulator|nr:DNA-binding response regulator [Oscillospiraceae bacterium]